MSSTAHSETGFTLIELVVTLGVLLIVSMTAAVGLTSRIPNLKLRAQAARVLETLSAARETALAQKVSQKVRFHQTRRATSVNDLFLQDDALTYGTHQLVFWAPVVLWFQSFPTPQTAVATRLFPPVLRGQDAWDAGVSGVLSVQPILAAWDLHTTPPADNVFPTSLASLRLPSAIEIDPYVRIVAINGRPTYSTGATSYASSPYTDPLPASPAPLSGLPPAPQTGTYNTADDRIGDYTYSPDGVFAFAPKSPSDSDYTITMATSVGAVSLADPDAITITIDRTSGLPHF